MHTTLITGHAVTATIALLATFGGRRPHWFAVHYGALVMMLVLLVAAIGVDVPNREAPELVIDAALVTLAVVMVAHTDAARRARRRDPRRFVERVGFSVVGLIDAFVVVTLFDAGAPLLAVVASGVAIAVVGHLTIHAVHARTDPAPPTPCVAAPSASSSLSHHRPPAASNVEATPTTPTSRP